MTKRERLTAAIAGNPVDRPPVALWRHFPGDDTNAEELAQSAAAFQHQFDWDFIKLTPSSHYSVADWGTTIAYRGHAHGTSDYTHYPVQTASDWANITPIDVHTGALGEQLTCIKRLRELVGNEVPIIETIFSPMDQARHLVGVGLELVHARRHAEHLAHALETITATTEAFVTAVLEAGADGVFFATQYARATHVSPDEYRTMCAPHDERILRAAQQGSFNLFHLHGQETYFDLVANYPIHALNWHDRETGPSLAEGKERFAGLVVGGISQQDIVEASPQQIHALATDAIASCGGRRVCLATGCVIPVVTPWCNIRALRRAVDAI